MFDKSLFIPINFQEAIAQILADRAYGKTLAESAYKLAKDEYSWDAIAQRVDKTMQALFPARQLKVKSLK